MHTSDGVVASVFGTDSTVAVAVEACHGLLAEEGEGFFEDWWAGFLSILIFRGYGALRRWMEGCGE